VKKRGGQQETERSVFIPGATAFPTVTADLRQRRKGGDAQLR
jgi:hypothetical protein